MPSSDIVVVGFGGIGMSVCVALRLRGINPAVVDVDSGKLALARAMEFPVGRSVTNFPRASIVIGCTGTAAVNLDDLMRLTNKPYLVSGSSKQIEFGDVLRRGNITKCAHLTNSDVDVSTGAIIVNNGKPINFLYGSLNDEMSDFMYADILAAVIEGGRIQRRGIRKLSEEWQAEVARRWERHYL